MPKRWRIEYTTQIGFEPLRLHASAMRDDEIQSYSPFGPAAGGKLFAIDTAMFGFAGFTATCRERGKTTKSMSSTGIDPKKASSPSTIAVTLAAGK
jgi:hypothetical protein